ncbi:MAG: glycosyltransferase family 2 protein [Nitratireductor sp.]|nr:glycosyltransferase family 2 protein [Nitratireductor sp.]
MSEDYPRVTALVPCYNSQEFIKNALSGLAAQTWPNLEILLADDCSNDNTVDILRAFAGEQGNVRLIERKRNLGWLDNSNDLMERANSEFAFFAYHDDVIAPDFVTKLVTPLICSPKSVVAYAALNWVRPGRPAEVRHGKALSAPRTALGRAAKIALLRSDWWLPLHGVFRTDAARRVGGLKRNLMDELSADHSWILHMALLGEFIRVDEVLMDKIVRPGSLSLAWNDGPEYPGHAIRRAAIREVWSSPAPWPTKAALDLALRYKILEKRIIHGVKGEGSFF